LRKLNYKGLRDSETVEIDISNPGRFILNSFISREHIRIQRQSNNIILVDLNSTNGEVVRMLVWR
jgi:pSer/pThr/pTyr-binding forkhead associated (FHA) protein